MKINDLILQLQEFDDNSDVLLNTFTDTCSLSEFKIKIAPYKVFDNRFFVTTIQNSIGTMVTLDKC